MLRPIDAYTLNNALVSLYNNTEDETEKSILRRVMQRVVHAPTLTPPDEPLTLEELRKMDGEPVYMTFPSDTGNQCGHWALVGTQRWGAVSLIYGCGWSSYESAVETLGAKFYRRPPEGEGDGAN